MERRRILLLIGLTAAAAGACLDFEDAFKNRPAPPGPAATVDACDSTTYAGLIQCAQPIAYYHLDESHGPILSVAGDAAPLGTQIGSIVSVPTGAIYAYGTSLAFNREGRIDYVDFGDDPVFRRIGYLPFSLEIWVRPRFVDPNDTFSDQMILSKESHFAGQDT